MSSISLCMRPKAAPLEWDEFCATHDPYGIALDGYVVAGSRFNPAGPHLNLDHHTEVDRLATRATCAQTLLAIRQGLFECFRDGHGPRAQACVNDCDEDICTAWFLLTHADLAAPGKMPRLDRLVSLVDVLDTTAGAYPLPADLSSLKELAWVFAPYHGFRRSGELDRREPEGHRGVVDEVSCRIERHLSGHGASYPLDGRYERRGGGPGWTLIREIGAQARLGVVADGIRAYVAVRERPGGRWAYVVGRMSPFAPFDVPSILHSLNEAEGPGGDGWGGSNLVGGSPRVRGSTLPPDKVEQIINKQLQASRVTHGTGRDLGLDLWVAFNKGAVMVLPSGVTKATGLAAALNELGLSPRNAAGIGDAENDHSFLKLCECSAAVANAVPGLKEHVDFCTGGEYGEGVVEFIDELVTTDLSGREPLLGRHHLLFGTRDNGAEVRARPYGANLLIAGPSGSGKSSAATAFLERLTDHKYQFCVIDPEGDYANFEGAMVLGNGTSAPAVDEVIRLLKGPDRNVVVNLLGLPLADRPSYFLALLPRLQELRATTGRPHWIVIDEAHHLLPVPWHPGDLVMSPELEGVVLITVHPDHVAPGFLALVDAVVAVGHSPERTLRQFCRALGEKPPALAPLMLESGEVVFWSRETGDAPHWVRVIPSRTERRRHSRKYAEGEVAPHQSFYFRGPEGKLNLRAQNLILFTQLAEGVDEGTWMYHLRRGDYSRWFRKVIKDKGLAAKAAGVESQAGVTAEHSRGLIAEAIEEHYTLPA